MGAVRGFAAGQIESDQVSMAVRFSVDFGRKPALRATECLAFLPPLWMARPLIEPLLYDGSGFE